MLKRDRAHGRAVPIPENLVPALEVVRRPRASGERGAGQTWSSGGGDVAVEALALSEPGEPRVHAGHGAAPLAEDPPPVDRRAGRDVAHREAVARDVVGAGKLRFEGLDRRSGCTIMLSCIMFLCIILE